MASRIVSPRCFIPIDDNTRTYWNEFLKLRRARIPSFQKILFSSDLRDVYVLRSQQEELRDNLIKRILPYYFRESTKRMWFRAHGLYRTNPSGDLLCKSRREMVYSSHRNQYIRRDYYDLYNDKQEFFEGIADYIREINEHLGKGALTYAVVLTTERDNPYGFDPNNSNQDEDLGDDLLNLKAA